MKELSIDELRVTTEQAQCRIQEEWKEYEKRKIEREERKEAEERKRAVEIIEKADQKMRKIALEGGSRTSVYSVPDREIDKRSNSKLGIEWSKYRSGDLCGVARKIAEHCEKKGFKTYLFCDYFSYRNAPSHLCPPIFLMVSWEKEE